ncbi:MAG: sigma-70 family RNA polymerase sigma factor [Clostridia bacterium]|nr:sigma-70 family RNA polymerase sigma factor [Clostridia bacterium]
MKKTDKKSDPESLIRAAKAGDGEAFETLSREYGGMIGAVISSFGSSIASADPEAGAVFSEEDLRQEAGIAFLRAVRTYDPESKPGVTFGLYAKICVRNAMISLFRKYRTRKRRLKRAGGKRGIAEVSAQSAEDDVDPGALFERAADLLSPLETAVFDAYLKGMKPAQTASLLGTAEKTVYNALYRAKTKVRGLSEN